MPQLGFLQLLPVPPPICLRFCGLQAMEAGWISAPIRGEGESFFLLVLGLKFSEATLRWWRQRLLK
jgi:hypothetical protein